MAFTWKVKFSCRKNLQLKFETVGQFGNGIQFFEEINFGKRCRLEISQLSGG